MHTIKLVHRSGISTAPVVIDPVPEFPLPEWLGDAWFDKFLGVRNSGKLGIIPESDLRQLKDSLGRMFPLPSNVGISVTNKIPGKYRYHMAIDGRWDIQPYSGIRLLVNRKPMEDAVAFIEEKDSMVSGGPVLMFVFTKTADRLSLKEKKLLIKDIRSQLTQLLHYGKGH